MGEEIAQTKEVLAKFDDVNCGAANLGRSRLSGGLSRCRRILATRQSRLKAGSSQDWLPHFYNNTSQRLVLVILQVPRKSVVRLRA